MCNIESHKIKNYYSSKFLLKNNPLKICSKIYDLSHIFRISLIAAKYSQ